MPILKECSACQRKGGYAENAVDKICARCKRNTVTVKVGDKDEDEE